MLGVGEGLHRAYGLGARLGQKRPVSGHPGCTPPQGSVGSRLNHPPLILEGPPHGCGVTEEGPNEPNLGRAPCTFPQGGWGLREIGGWYWSRERYPLIFGFGNYFFSDPFARFFKKI